MSGQYPGLTFGQMRKNVRALKSVGRRMREAIEEAVKAQGLSAVEGVSLTVSRQEFERVEWAMGRLKQWLPALDEAGQVIPGVGSYVRMNALFCRTDLARTHFLMKGCPVFYAEEPHGI
jgi:hypothetical protein